MKIKDQKRYNTRYTILDTQDIQRKIYVQTKTRVENQTKIIIN
jgi:hypothetical protein